jgi:hypothetical protein
VKPPNIYGNGHYLDEGKHNIISYDANMGKNKTISLPGVMNSYYSDADATTLETPANINYRLIENTLGFQFYRVTKEDMPLYTGFGGGIQNFPYGFLMLGYNGKPIELGGTAFWGLVINKASYEGSINNSYVDEYVKLENVYILHSYGGLVAHASYYWEKFALNYAASISNPWLVDKLPIPENGNAFVSFFFPYLLMQDIGISYTPYKIKYRLGVNQITGLRLPGQYWGLSVQMAYGW